MPFQKGHKLAKGGEREGAGRPSTQWREYCQGIFDKHKLLERMVKIAKGEPIDIVTDVSGKPLIDSNDPKRKKIVMIPAPLEVQRKAIVDLKEWGRGKSVQEIESSALSDILDQLRDKFK